MSANTLWAMGVLRGKAKTMLLLTWWKKNSNWFVLSIIMRGTFWVFARKIVSTEDSATMWARVLWPSRSKMTSTSTISNSPKCDKLRRNWTEANGLENVRKVLLVCLLVFGTIFKFSKKWLDFPFHCSQNEHSNSESSWAKSPIGPKNEQHSLLQR